MSRKSETIQALKKINRNSQEQARAKIRVINLVEKLHDCVDGNIELTREQLKAIDILLAKSLPNLTNNLTETEVNHTHSISPATLQLLQSFNSKALEKLVKASVIEDIQDAEIIENMGNKGDMVLSHSSDNTAIQDKIQSFEPFGEV